VNDDDDEGEDGWGTPAARPGPWAALGVAAHWTCTV
jgi:hypothetical protein